MTDGDRRYPVNIFVLHHSTGPVFADTPDVVIQDWFSAIGRDRGYQGGALNPSHEHPSRPGQLTYAMAQFAGSPDSSSKYNYKLTDLIKNPWQNVAWHCGNWDINVISVGLENCGNFLNMILEDRQLMCIADFLRPIDQELGGTLQIMLHQEIFATACPARIKDQRDKLVDMVNRPDYWNNALFAPAPPPPAPPTPPKPAPPVAHPVPDAVKLPQPLSLLANLDKVEVWNLTSNPNYQSVKTLSKGETFGAYATITFNNTVYYVTEYSFGKGLKHGINSSDMIAAPMTPPPVVLPPVVPIPEPDYPNWFVEFWLKVIEFIKNLVTKKEK